MKKVIYSLAAVLMLACFTSCDYDGSDDAKVTKYVSLELKGDNPLLVPVGGTFTEPGYTATEGTEDVTSKVQIGGDEIDPNELGIYYVTYSATNVDGFSKSATRQVLVYNPEVTTNIAGVYTIEAAECSNSGILGAYPINGNPVTIKQLAPGLYSISDWWGGAYELGAGYGSAYRASGYFSLGTDNKIEGISGSCPWPDIVFKGATGEYDAASGKVTVQSLMQYNIKMTLTK